MYKFVLFCTIIPFYLFGQPNPSARPAAYIFDWDDTLFPTYPLSKLCDENGLSIATSSTEDLMHVSRHIDWKSLDKSVYRTLTAFDFIGDVWVVSAASMGWVDRTAAVFLPKTYELLQIFHTENRLLTRDLAVEYEECANCGKDEHFFYISLIPEKNYRYIFSIGDGDHEFDALRNTHHYYQREIDRSSQSYGAIRLAYHPEDVGTIIKQLKEVCFQRTTFLKALTESRPFSFRVWNIETQNKVYPISQTYDMADQADEIRGASSTFPGILSVFEDYIRKDEVEEKSQEQDDQQEDGVHLMGDEELDYIFPETMLDW